tara:strand:+ start:44 stop:202 length:159 start_codon:yes stop_codon:yes gene_type:complete
MSMVKAYKHQLDAERQRQAIEDMECTKFHEELFTTFDKQLSLDNTTQEPGAN